MAEAQKKTAPEAPAPEADDKLVILNLGKKSRKSIKRLRQGRGKLMERVQGTIDQLRSENELSDTADVIVVIVKEGRKSRGLFF